MNYIMDNMPYVSLMVFALICLFSKDYRRSAFVLLIAFIINIVLLPIYTWMVETDNYDVSFICGGIDAITAFFMLKYGNKDKLYQGGILITAVLMNAVSLLSIGVIPKIIFNYIIFIMNLAQILIILGGIYGRSLLDIYKGSPPDTRGIRVSINGSHDMEKM